MHFMSFAHVNNLLFCLFRSRRASLEIYKFSIYLNVVTEKPNKTWMIFLHIAKRKICGVYSWRQIVWLEYKADRKAILRMDLQRTSQIRTAFFKNSFYKIWFKEVKKNKKIQYKNKYFILFIIYMKIISIKGLYQCERWKFGWFSGVF